MAVLTVGLVWAGALGCARIGFESSRSGGDTTATTGGGGDGGTGDAASDSANLLTTIRVDTTADLSDPSHGDNVCGSGVGTCSLRAAIEESNALPGRQRVEVPVGSYDLDTTSSLTITASTDVLGDAVDEVIVTGRGGARVIAVDLAAGAGPVLISNLVFRADPVNQEGGGVYVEAGSVTLSNCRFFEITTLAAGGAVRAATGTSLTIDDTLFVSNSATGASGGAIDTDGDLVVTDSYFFQNDADQAGAIGARGALLSIEGVVLRENGSRSGGALRISGCPAATILRSLIHSNTADGGAGLWIGTSSLTLEDTTFAENFANNGSGGAIRSFETDLNATNTTFASNQATSNGAALMWLGTDRTFSCVNCTIVRNDSALGGALDMGGTNQITRLRNTILANNFIAGLQSSAGANCQSGGGSYILNNNNLLDYDDPACPAGVADVIAGTPRLALTLGGARADGRVVTTVAPLPGSPAIDSGDTQSCPPTDALGRARVGLCDIGADEYQAPASRGPTIDYGRTWYLALRGAPLNVGGLTPRASAGLTPFSVFPPLPAGMTLNPADGTLSGVPREVRPPVAYTIGAVGAGRSASTVLGLAVSRGFVVNRTTDGSDAAPDGFCNVGGALDDSDCSLRAAIEELGGDGVVYLDAASYAFTSGFTLAAGDRLAVNGTGRSNTTLSVPADVFNFQSAELWLADLQILNSGGVERPLEVGAGARLNLSHVEMLDNTTNGAITSNDAIVLAEYTRFDNNDAMRGGAIEALGGVVALRSCELTNNDGTQEGGAVYFEAGPGGGESLLVLQGSTLWNNSAGTDGGAVMLDNPEFASLAFVDSTFYQNAAARGGALYSDCTTVPLTMSLQNVTMAENVVGMVGAAWGATSGCVALSLNSVYVQNTDVMPALATCNQNMVSVGFNVIDDVDGACGLTTMAGDVTAAAPAAINLGSLGVTGASPVATLHPGASSILIDAGSTQFCSPTDAHGGARPADGDGDSLWDCDIGATEQ